MREFAIVLLALLGTVLVTVALAYWSNSYHCSTIHDDTGMPTKYVHWKCYVQVRGQWVPESAWRVEH